MDDIYNILKIAGKEGLYLVVIILFLSLIASMFKWVKTLKVHSGSNHALADSVEKNFQSLGDSLKQMAQMNSEHYKSLVKMGRIGYLNTDLSIDLYRCFAEIHIQKKLTFIRKLLKTNDIKNREYEIKKNIETEFKKITYKACEQVSRFNSCIGDMGKIAHDNIDWNEFLTETYEIFFNKRFTVAQKMNDLRKNMDRYINKIEQILKIYGDSNQ